MRVSVQAKLKKKRRYLLFVTAQTIIFWHIGSATPQYQDNYHCVIPHHTCIPTSYLDSTLTSPLCHTTLSFLRHTLTALALSSANSILFLQQWQLHASRQNSPLAKQSQYLCTRGGRRGEGEGREPINIQYHRYAYNYPTISLHFTSSVE